MYLKCESLSLGQIWSNPPVVQKVVQDHPQVPSRAGGSHCCTINGD